MRAEAVKMQLVAAAAVRSGLAPSPESSRAEFVLAWLNLHQEMTFAGGTSRSSLPVTVLETCCSGNASKHLPVITARSAGRRPPSKDDALYQAGRGTLSIGL